MKILLFGIGENTDKILRIIRSDVEIVGCIDNDEKKQGKTYAGKEICSVRQGLLMEYDYIVLGFTAGYEEAITQLSEYGVGEGKISIPYSFYHNMYKGW